MPEYPPIRLLLVDDQQMWLEALPALLSSAEEVEIVGLASGGVEALRLCSQEKPDLVLLDMAMPDMDGLETLGKLLALQAGIKVLFLTTYDDVSLIMEGLVGGAQGVVLKGSSKSELLRAIKQVHEGNYYCDPQVFGKIVEYFRQHGKLKLRADTTCPLTSREREVLALKAQGKTNKDIAEELFLSEHTVNTHMKNVLSKLDAKNTVEAIDKGRQAGCL